MTDKPKTILERVQNLENNLRGLADNLGRLDQFNTNLGDVVEVLQALLAEVGAKQEGFEGAVELRVQKARDEKRKQRDQRAAEAIKQMADNGTIVASDKVSTQSLLVGRVFNKDGNVVAERVQGILNAFPEQLRAQLLDKGVGETVKDLDESTFELLEIYEFGSPKPVTEAVVAATEQPAQEPAQNQAPTA